MTEEKRRAPRIAFTASAHITVKGESVSMLGTISNISRVGLGIQAKESVPAGSFVTLEIKFLDEAKKTVVWNASGAVVRCQEAEHGYFIGVDLAEAVTKHNAPELDAILSRAGA